MDQREFGDRAALTDAEWTRRVQEAARADVRAMLRSTRRRRAERWLVTVMVLVAVVAVGMLMVRVGMFDRSASRDSASSSTGSAPLTPAGPAIDLTRPFDATPAANWTDGVAGIVVPAPMQVGEFSARQVEQVTARVRDALVASRLDRALLVGHQPEGYLALLAPDARGQLAPLFGSGRETQAQALVSLVAAGSPLLPIDPKVTGRMSVEAGGPGELVVHTNYVFAYAFGAPPDARLTDPMDVVVVVRAQVDYVYREGPRWTKSSRGLWYGHVGGYGYSIACDAYKRGFLAPAYSDRAVKNPTPLQDRAAYFDPSAPLPPEGGCPA